MIHKGVVAAARVLHILAVADGVIWWALGLWRFPLWRFPVDIVTQIAQWMIGLFLLQVATAIVLTRLLWPSPRQPFLSLILATIELFGVLLFSFTPAVGAPWVALAGVVGAALLAVQRKP